MPGRSRRQISGIEIHRSVTLSDADVTVIRGIRCTTAARTLLDLAGVLDRRGLERAVDQAEILELFDLTALHEQLRRNPGRRGARRLGELLTAHQPATTTRSELEERFLALIRRAGLPVPEVNAWVVLPDSEPAVCADFVWRAQRLIIETDGLRTHDTRHAFEHNRRTDQRLTLCGWRVVRVTWRQLRQEPARVEQMMRALLAQ